MYGVFTIEDDEHEFKAIIVNISIRFFIVRSDHNIIIKCDSKFLIMYFFLLIVCFKLIVNPRAKIVLAGCFSNHTII